MNSLNQIVEQTGSGAQVNKKIARKINTSLLPSHQGDDDHGKADRKSISQDGP